MLFEENALKLLVFSKEESSQVLWQGPTVVDSFESQFNRLY